MLGGPQVQEVALNRCPYCDAAANVEPSAAGEAPCPQCGHLLWLVGGRIQAVLFPAPGGPDEPHGKARVAVCLTSRILGDERTPTALFEKLFGLGEVPVRRDLILDFRNVQFIASAALGKLMTLHRKLQRHRNRLRLTNLGPELRQVFRRTRLDELFIIDSGEGA